MAVTIVRRFVDTDVPAAPTGLATSDPTATGITLTWTVNAEVGLSHYSVYRSVDGLNWGFRASTASNQYTDTAEPGTYYWAISAWDANSGFESPLSDSVSAEISIYQLYDASQRVGTPNALPAALLPLAAGDTYRQDGPVTPAGYGTISFGNYGYFSAAFIPQQSPVITYSTHAIGAQVVGTGALTIPLAAANPNLLGKELLLFTGSFGSGDTMTTTPAAFGYGLLHSTGSMEVWWKVGTASETAPTFTYSGASSKGGWMLSRTSSSAWPATTPLVGTPTSAINSSLTSLRYQAYTIPSPNLDGYQFSLKLINGATNPVSAVTVTSGYTSVGSAINNVTNGIVLAAQVKTGDAYGSNLLTNDVVTTGNTVGGGSRRMSFSIKGAVTFSSQSFSVPMRFQRAATGVNTTYNLVLNP